MEFIATIVGNALTQLAGAYEGVVLERVGAWWLNFLFGVLPTWFGDNPVAGGLL